MIFHLPYNVDPKVSSGSHLRPIRMLNAFKTIGYKVDCVMGYGAIRREQIKKIKKNIETGVKYDFVYSESSTTPTLLTEEHHFPLFPFLDFNFLKFCKENQIKIGLFYRDIYWKFKEGKEGLSLLKRAILRLFYKFDLWQYKRLVDILYLPSRKMYSFIHFRFKKKIKALPPGIDRKNLLSKEGSNLISFIYVGGLGPFYDLNMFFKTIAKFKDLNFRLCTRAEDWKNNRIYYEKYLNNSIEIFHKNSNELEEDFLRSDIAVLFTKPIDYSQFAMPTKLFEYISYKKPIIAVRGIATGDFVEKNNIGWVIDYDENELYNLIKNLKNNKNEIKKKIKNIEKIIPQNTWEARAVDVKNDLCNITDLEI